MERVGIKRCMRTLRKNDPGRTILIFNNSPEDIAKWMAQPGVVVVSDGMAIQDKISNTTLGFPLRRQVGSPA